MRLGHVCQSEVLVTGSAETVGLRGGPYQQPGCHLGGCKICRPSESETLGEHSNLCPNLASGQL